MEKRTSKIDSLYPSGNHHSEYTGHSYSRYYNLKIPETPPKTKIIPIQSLTLGGKGFVVMAGPCAIESREQILETAQMVAKAGAHILRGGAFKPRSSPHSFQGLKEIGLDYLIDAKQTTGLPVVTEIIAPTYLDMMLPFVDVFQVGARNMYNYHLLEALGQIDKPILLKRGPSATLDDLMKCIDYIVLGGNGKIILCERGIRTFETATRNTLDLSMVALLKQITSFPVVVDPSHGTGLRSLILPMSKAAIVAGADGLLIETHINPNEAQSDGFQSLFPEQFQHLMTQLEPLLALEGRSLHHPV